MEIPVPQPRLTREEFRSLAKAKGWKFTMLAKRWGVTPEWVSEVSRDPQRDLRYDDALYGLPDLHHLQRDLRQRARQVTTAQAGRQPIRRAPKVSTPGYRYRGYLVPGAVVTVANAFGSIVDEGARGIVFQVEQGDRQEIYGVLFENGAHESFAPDLVDQYLVATGLIAQRAAAYCHRDNALLMRAHRAGEFDFWPEATTPLIQARF